MSGIGLGTAMAKVTMGGDKKPRCARDEMRECTRDQESVGGPADSKTRAASGRVGCYVGKFKFARGKGKQPRGRDMWATWAEQEWMDWMETRRGTGGRETGHTVQRATVRARARARARNAKPMEIEIEIDDMAMEMGRASPSRTASPARIESRPGLLMERSVHLSSLPSSLSHFPLSFEASTVPGPGWMSSKPRHPPWRNHKCVVYRPCRPNLGTPPHPAAAMLGEGAGLPSILLRRPP